MQRLILKVGIAILFFFFLVDATDAQPVDAETLFSAFRQGARGNCASIAIIKAAINKFGVNAIFAERVLPDSTTEVTLKNKQKYIITIAEWTKAIEAADFRLQNKERTDILDYANRCYAVMAKARQHLEGLESYEQALKLLNRGYYTPDVYELLGLENYFAPMKKFSSIDNLCAVVAWRTKHAVFSCNGYMDDHGRKKKIGLRYYGRFRLNDAQPSTEAFSSY